MNESSVEFLHFIHIYQTLYDTNILNDMMNLFKESCLNLSDFTHNQRKHINRGDFWDIEQKKWIIIKED